MVSKKEILRTDGRRYDRVTQGSLDLVLRRVRLMPPAGPHQRAPVQDSQRLLYGALREPGLLGDLAMTEPYPLARLAGSATPEEQVHHEGGRTVIVAHEVPQENIDHVVVQAKGWLHGAIGFNTIAITERLYRISRAVS